MKWLSGLALLLLTAALEDPELTQSIQALFDEEGAVEKSQQPEVKPIHSKLFDPFEEPPAAGAPEPFALEKRQGGAVKMESTLAEADPFAELAASVSPSSHKVTPVATKMDESKLVPATADPFAELAAKSVSGHVRKAVAVTKMDDESKLAPATADPFAELAAKSVSRSHALERMAVAKTDESKLAPTKADPFAGLAAKSVAASHAMKPVAATRTEDELSKLAPHALKADPFAELAAKSVSGSHVRKAVAVTKMDDESKLPKTSSNVVKLARSNQSAASLKHVAQHIAANNQTAVANRTADPVQLAVKSNQSHNMTRTPVPPIQAAAFGSLRKAPKGELPAKAAMPTPEAENVPAKVPATRSLAAFWAGDSLPLAAPHPLMLVQDAAVSKAHRGIDFTQSDEKPEEEISISDPWRALEAQDAMEVQQLKQQDSRLRLRAKRRQVEPQTAKLVSVGTSGPWAKLEEEDQRIEDTILDLDDPRRPVDLRQYQRLNNLQDASMEKLEGHN